MGNHRRSQLVTRDGVTGLRRNPVRWPNGRPPVPSGCRWCGTEEHHHGHSYVASVGIHTWEMPTVAQMMARMRARRRAREAAKVADRFHPIYRDEIMMTMMTISAKCSWPEGPWEVED